ncbi:MAG TPA: SDR family NAD(P)-dependent oxidoreductase [Solimonas sp.]|nr:SDR family NAD(P)-dependent oxidoreductase [Solimonas sp.]
MAIADLHGRRVLITGAASGIGRAATLAFARRGARIIAVDLNISALQTLKRDVETLGVACSIHAVDVSDAAAMQALAETVHARGGALDVLVNNAGIGYLGRFLDSDLEHWPRVLGVNVMGVVHGCRFFIPAMVAAGGARRVLIVSSSAGNYPAPTMAAYAASKGAVWSFAEVLKMELAGSGVGVTTICPGVIDTPIVHGRANIARSVTDEQIGRLQAYYREQGCAPERVAEDMVRAVREGGDIVLTGPYARIVHHARRVSLKLVRRLMIRSARRAGYL